MNKNKIFKYIIIFILVFVWNMFIVGVNGDEIWEFGFAYNVSLGYLPYRDFSTVVPPLFSFLYSIPLLIFGRNLLIHQLFNTGIVTGMLYLLDKMYGKKSYILIIIMLLGMLTLMPGYNVLLLSLYVLLIYLEKKKSNDYLIGFVLALLLLTKHTVGGFLIIVGLLYFIKDTNKIKKRFIGILIPCLICLIYFILTKTLMSFLDLCVFGLFDFGSKNGSSISIFFIFSVILLISLLLIIKKDKEKRLFGFYTLAFYMVIVPLFDIPHIVLFLVAYTMYMFDNFEFEAKINLELLVIGLYTICSIILLKGNSPIYNHNLSNIKYRRLESNVVDACIKVNDYINRNRDKDFIFFNSEGYLFRIINNQRIYNYDMNLYGNHGYNGTEKILEEIKDKKGAYIMLDVSELDLIGQEDREAINYIINNGIAIDHVAYYDIYILKESN